MEDKIIFSWVWHKDLQPMEWLQYIADSFSGLADLWDEYDSNFFENEFEDYKNEYPQSTKKEMYNYIAWERIDGEGLIHNYLCDSMDIVKEIEHVQGNILKAFENSIIFPNLIDAIGIVDSVMNEAKSFYDDFCYYLRYKAYIPLNPTSKDIEQIIEHFGRRASNRLGEERELTEDDYQCAFDCVTELIEKIEKACFSKKLRESAWAIKGYCKLKVGSKEYSETEDRRPVSLIQFMRKHCEKQSIKLLRYRRKSLNDAHFRKSITLPEPTRNWKTGQAKYYNPSELKKNWPSYCEILPNLPQLKQSK